MKNFFLLYILMFLFPVYLSAQCFESLQFGGGHTIGQMPDGSWWGWGNNTAGALLETQWNLNVEPNPIQIMGAQNDWDKIFLGLFNTYVIKEDGTLWGAGTNKYGSLGVNSNTNQYNTLQPITTSNNWIKVSSASFHSLALKSDGTIWGWGLNDVYQLGISPASTSGQLYPVQMGTDTDWVDLDAGRMKSSFGLKSDGTIWGWGSNINNIIVGAGSPNYANYISTPTQIGTDNDWIGMSVGGGHILAQKTDSTLWIWGGGVLLDTASGYSALTNIPQQISSDKWIDFSAGLMQSYGIKEDGTLWSWGLGGRGELGLGDTLDYLIPQQVGTDNNWMSVQAGIHSVVMATKTDGTVWFWGGENYWGEYGNGESYLLDLILEPTQTDGICVNTNICDDLGVELSLDEANYTLTASPSGMSYQWLDCDDNSVIPGETNMSFTPSVDGHYAVIVSEGNCSDTSACVFVETVGIGELGFGDKTFSIHPNPAKDLAVVSYDLASINANLEVYDLLGRSLYKQELMTNRGELSLDISGFVSGVYIVVIREENGMVMQRRLVVE